MGPGHVCEMQSSPSFLPGKAYRSGVSAFSYQVSLPWRCPQGVNVAVWEGAARHSEDSVFLHCPGPSCEQRRDGTLVTGSHCASLSVFVFLSCSRIWEYQPESGKRAHPSLMTKVCPWCPLPSPLQGSELTSGCGRGIEDGQRPREGAPGAVAGWVPWAVGFATKTEGARLRGRERTEHVSPCGSEGRPGSSREGSGWG